MSKRRSKGSRQKPAGGKSLFSKKISMVVYVLVLLLAVAARTYQYYTNMDYTSGKYIDNDISKNYTIMVLVCGFALLAFTLTAGGARDKVIDSCIMINPWRLRYDRLNKKIPNAAGMSALLMAVLIASQIFFDVSKIVQNNQMIASALPRAERDNYNMLTGYSYPMIARHILMLLVVFTFGAIASNIFKGEGFSHANCAALSTYCIWQTIQIFEIASGSALRLNSDTVYIMAARMTAVIFFLMTARFFNGMEKKNTRFWMCFMGYVSSILAAVSVIPRYAMLIFPDGVEERIETPVPDTADAGIIFITITVIAVFWSTYVYRDMPKGAFGVPRAGRPNFSANYVKMETIEQDPEAMEAAGFAQDPESDITNMDIFGLDDDDFTNGGF